LGKRATAFVRELVEGRPVRLEFDEAFQVRKHQDRYGRTLAYVYFTPLPCDELEPLVAEQVCESDLFDRGFLNGLILWAGYATAYTRYPFKQMEQFRAWERDAREKSRGLWKPEPIKARLPQKEPSIPPGNKALLLA
jgi:endonuclease YncB( thermonuclease family)